MTHPLDGAISGLVDRQLGHITRGQLLASGAHPDWIRSRIRRGGLIPVYAGVYAVGHVPRHAHARSMAAVLVCGEGAALSHAAAAALWGVADWPATLEVTAPSRRRRPGLRTHQSQSMTSADIRRRHGVPVTSPARTVLDLRPRFSDARLVRLVNELRLAGHLNRRAFGELCRACGRIDRLLGDGALTRSSLEDLFRRFVRRHGLPMPELNVTLPGTGREVDALYRDARLIIELDSWTFHRDRASFERDRGKDAAALALGFRTLRTTAARLTGDGTHEAMTIRQILAASWS